jgi:hypothetical protein
MEEEHVVPDWHERVDPAVRRRGQPRFNPAHRVDASFGSALALRGYDLRSPTVRRGGILDVTWYFESRRPLKGPWKLFVHVIGPGFMTADHDLVEGLLPLQNLYRGMEVADRQRILVQPHLRPGTYTIYLGVYAARARLPVSGDGAEPRQNRVAAATFTVLP